MKISRDWLGDFVDWLETDPAVIADRLTRGMGEVDEVEMQGSLLADCVVGKVLSIEKHPNADKLSVCTVQTDRGVKKVVCGGTNLKKDMLTAFAHTGAKVRWHGGEIATLAPVKIRGIESDGMICASEELDIETLFPPSSDEGQRPIADLTKGGYQVGASLRQALGLSDVIFHIDNHAITNRPDLFSHRGIARELVAMGVATAKKERKKSPMKFPSMPTPFRVVNEAKESVPYYEACLLSVPPGVESPEWMQKRLISTGWRPINLIVDVTNYVMMEVGMPLHAFDADDFKGDIRVRRAKKGEKITTLDKSVRELPEGSLVMSDDAGIFDLFGIMGGLRTSGKRTTTNVYLHANIPDPISIRKTVIDMGHRTDAATVYEKGVMPVTAAIGFRRAIELLQELAPGTRVTSKIITWGTAPKPKAVRVSPEKIAVFIGAPLSSAKIKKIVSDLGCKVVGSGTSLTVTPPAWRRDIQHIQDIAEEVSRVYGYANVTPSMPEASTMPPARDRRIHQLRDALKEERYTELLNPAFTSPGTIEKAGLSAKDAVRIENPIGEELSRMRTSLLPGILEVASREAPKADKGILKVYEHGHVFSPGVERPEFVLLVAAKGRSTVKNEPVLIAKADAVRAFRAAGHTLMFRQTKDSLAPFAHAGRNAEILLGGKRVGVLTEIHPSIAKAFDLPGRAAAVIVDLDAVLKTAPDIFITKPLPLFPAVEFDETLPLSGKSHASLLDRAQKTDPLLKSVIIADLYEGEGNRTVTLRFTYRADDRTLTQEEVEKIHGKVLSELKKG